MVCGSIMEHYGWCVGALWSIMGGVWEHYGALWVVCGSIMEHYGWCVGALWVVCGSIRERNYRLKKKNDLVYNYMYTEPPQCVHNFRVSEKFIK